ncbi:hypothetical protein F2Q69_00031136 [Brassica cretica]|uniref:Uncharacterized protein n=1 Tax=Brassica cretica TaxID=69181 RepID=A0A8S9S883_BRACR|nr:hypothetical protein F2Q69_00031136 [Brassica cretica]
MSKARADLVSLVHAQQYQKQQGNSTAILTRSCKFGAFDPQRSTLLIDRQQHLHQILQVWSVRSAKKHAPHRSTTTPVHRSISFNAVDPCTIPVD